MGDVVSAFYAWLASSQGDRTTAASEPADVQRYFHGISRARYVIRKVFRIVDELAKRAGMDPLEHQALIQVFGADERLRVNDVAERLDIPPALASRLVKSLDEKGFIVREPSQVDRRTTLVSTTDAGRRLLVDIDTQLQLRIAGLQEELSDLDRATALGIFAFYLGAAPPREQFGRLETLFQSDAP
jgi:DNA-binding MarR family transcriptional regulator